MEEEFSLTLFWFHSGSQKSRIYNQGAMITKSSISFPTLTTEYSIETLIIERSIASVGC